ncbi:MAG: TRAP transporter small permease subunit [Xanthomonadales bacterium]|nr:TRAP transporter small permease subunit [Xanthomonadales bacterium]
MSLTSIFSPDSAARLVSRVGRSVAWLTLLMTLMTFLVVVLRYGFNEGWIWMQESVTYLHATVFMAAAAWAFQTGDHVRVDIFYREASPAYRHRVDIAGTLLFLLPFSLFLLYTGWDYVASSWAVRETSAEPGGLPLVWLLKTLVLVLPVLLLLQSGVTVAQSLAGLREIRARAHDG